MNTNLMAAPSQRTAWPFLEPVYPLERASIANEKLSRLRLGVGIGGRGTEP
jgi:hypothetical protein